MTDPSGTLQVQHRASLRSHN
ncbi:MAG: hypothetical protein RL227_2414, partial [Pseudomonadota bacterium]